MPHIGLWHIGENGPSRLPAGTLSLERELEGWIERDPGLLEQGLLIVGRQIRLEAGPVDLLAVDPQGRLVLIEIKRGRLRREVVAQAIDYASCLESLSHEAICGACDGYLRSRCGVGLTELLAQQNRPLVESPEDREIVIYLVGTGIDPGLERMAGFLSNRADLAVRFVTFSVFAGADGAPMLAREIHEIDHQPAASAIAESRSRPNLDELLRIADENGVGGPTRELASAATDLGLVARAYKRSIMFAPASNRTRCLFVVWVDRRRERGVVKAYFSAEAFEQFFGIDAAALNAALGIVAYTMLDMQGATRVANALRRLLRVAD